MANTPGKSENWLMVGIEPEYKLWFKGENAPCAMVEVSIFGGTSEKIYENLTQKICKILNETLDIPQARSYVTYTEIDNWGWNGGNF